jgi:hypothetical protein
LFDSIFNEANESSSACEPGIVFLGIIVVSSFGAFFYLKAKRKPPRQDEKNLKKEIRRWEGEGGSIPDFRQAKNGKALT